VPLQAAATLLRTARAHGPLPAVATLLRAAQILLGRRCRLKRPRRFYAPLKSCLDAGAASSGGGASTRRSNPALMQVPLPVVATLLRAAQILLWGRCRLQRWRRFYAPLKPCSDAGAASSGGDAATRRSNLLWRRCPFQRRRRFYAQLNSCSGVGAASSGGGASTRRSNPARTQVPLQAAAALLRAAQILL